MDVQVIKGPIAPLSTGSTVYAIYQVTLASGMIITNPGDFGVREGASVTSPVIVAEDGRVLTRAANPLWRKLEEYEPGATEDEVLDALDKVIQAPREGLS